MTCWLTERCHTSKRSIQSLNALINSLESLKTGWRHMILNTFWRLSFRQDKDTSQTRCCLVWPPSHSTLLLPPPLSPSLSFSPPPLSLSHSLSRHALVLTSVVSDGDVHACTEASKTLQDVAKNFYRLIQFRILPANICSKVGHQVVELFKCILDQSCTHDTHMQQLHSAKFVMFNNIVWLLWARLRVNSSLSIGLILN